MKEETKKIKEYKDDFLEPYNFTIKSDEHYVYRYFPSYKRLKQFLDNGIYMSQATSFSDGLECVDKDTILELKSQHAYQQEISNFNVNYSLNQFAIKIQEIQKDYFISCWYLPEKQHENELMWRSYGNPNGWLVKVKLSDFLKHLSNSRTLNLNKGKIIYGIVQYFDFNKEENLKYIKYKAFRKHNSYSDERELRLVIKGSSDEYSGYIKLVNDFYRDVKIFISPAASNDEFVSKRNEILSKYDVAIEQSELNLAYKLKDLVL